jgi:phasin family protein
MSTTTNTPASAKSKVAEAVSAVNEATAAAATKGYDQAAGAFDASIAQGAAGFEKTQAKMKEGMEKAMKTAEEFVTFSQGNLDAFVKSGQIWAAGMQDISKQVAATAQASFEETLSTFRALTGVKSLKDAVDLQASLARSTLEKTVSESSRLTDASMKLAEQTIAPLTARVTLAVEKFARTA